MGHNLHGRVAQHDRLTRAQKARSLTSWGAPAFQPRSQTERAQSTSSWLEKDSDTSPQKSAGAAAMLSHWRCCHVTAMRRRADAKAPTCRRHVAAMSPPYCYPVAGKPGGPCPRGWTTRSNECRVAHRLCAILLSVVRASLLRRAKALYAPDLEDWRPGPQIHPVLRNPRSPKGC